MNSEKYVEFDPDNCIEKAMSPEMEPTRSLVQSDGNLIPLVKSPMPTSNPYNHGQVPQLPNYQRTLPPPLYEIMTVPLSIRQSQELKTTLMKNDIEIWKHFNMRRIDYLYQSSIYQMKQEGQGAIPGVITSTTNSSEYGDAVKNSNTDKNSILQGFVYKPEPPTTKVAGF